MTELLREALGEGDPAKVTALINAGADIHYQAPEGYDAFIDAVHHRDVPRDPHLLELLTLLIDHGVPLTGMSTYGESGVRVLSRLGRFDGVKLLLDAGANPADIEFTPLIEAVAFGTLADVETLIAEGVNLEEVDYWERTPWLIAIQTGDIAKAKTLLAHGARRDARGRGGNPALFYAIEAFKTPMLEWLLEIGVDVAETNEYGNSAVRNAARYDNAEAIPILVRAKAALTAESDGDHHFGPLWDAHSREVAMALLDAGADPKDLSTEGRRAILGYPPEPDVNLLHVTLDDFEKYRERRLGAQNPEVMTNPFWEGMIRSGVNAYLAAVRVEGDRDYTRDRKIGRGPIWCADRFGQSLTFLPDGRIVHVAGEHEDGSDPDFCIYNDVFVHDTEGKITIYGYPASVFPPTDFHTATLIGDFIYLIGSLGYMGHRHFGTTQVRRLNTNTFQIERLETSGDNPGWIYKHRADLSNPQEIQVTGGKIVTFGDHKESHTENQTAFTLNIETLVWTRS